MPKKLLEENCLEKDQFEKKETQKELRRKIIIGSVLCTMHRKQGTMPYLINLVEPYLRKEDRKLFGLLF